MLPLLEAAFLGHRQPELPVCLEDLPLQLPEAACLGHRHLLREAACLARRHPLPREAVSLEALLPPRHRADCLDRLQLRLPQVAVCLVPHPLQRRQEVDCSEALPLLLLPEEACLDRLLPLQLPRHPPLGRLQHRPLELLRPPGDCLDRRRQPQSPNPSATVPAGGNNIIIIIIIINNNNKAIYEKSKPQNVGKMDFTEPFYQNPSLVGF